MGSAQNPALAAQLLQIYELLFAHFGPRHWWPAETPFEVVVGAYLTQNVSWRNVEQAIAAMKERGWLEPAPLARALVAQPDEVAAVLRPTRYFHEKRDRLAAFVRFLYQEYHGKLEQMFAEPLATLRPKLLALPGVGPETADAILCYAGGYPVMTVDAYTRRVFARLGLAGEKEGYAALQLLFHENLPAEPALFNEYHALIDGLAHYFCQPRPRCLECPLQSVCERQGVARESGPT